MFTISNSSKTDNFSINGRIFHIFFTTPDTRKELVQYILSAKKTQFCNLFYMFKGTNLKMQEAGLARDIFMLIVGMLISDITLVTFEEQYFDQMEQYLQFINSLCNLRGRTNTVIISPASEKKITELAERFKLKIYNDEFKDRYKKIFKKEKSYPQIDLEKKCLTQLNSNLSVFHKFSSITKFFSKKQSGGSIDIFFSQTIPYFYPIKFDFAADLIFIPETNSKFKLLLSHQAASKLSSKHSFVLANPNSKRLIFPYLEKNSQLSVYTKFVSNIEDNQLAFKFSLFLSQYAVFLDIPYKKVLKAIKKEVLWTLYKPVIILNYLETKEYDEKKKGGCPIVDLGMNSFAKINHALAMYNISSQRLGRAYIHFMKNYKFIEDFSDQCTGSFEKYLQKKVQEFLGANFGITFPEVEVYEEKRDTFYGILYSITLLQK